MTQKAGAAQLHTVSLDFPEVDFCSGVTSGLACQNEAAYERTLPHV